MFISTVHKQFLREKKVMSKLKSNREAISTHKIQTRTFHKELGDGLAAVDLDGVDSIVFWHYLRDFQDVGAAISDELKPIVLSDDDVVLQPGGRDARFGHLAHKADRLPFQAVGVRQWTSDTHRAFCETEASFLKTIMRFFTLYY